MPDGPWPESFLEMMAVERGAARHTLDAYRRDLADIALAGQLFAPHYARPMMRSCGARPAFMRGGQ